MIAAQEEPQRMYTGTDNQAEKGAKLMMRTFLTSTVAAAAIVGAALLGAAPANAQSFSIGIAPGGIGFSYDSGGYCDDYGCPDDFWDYPLYYCPVYFRGQWYDGPVYYRQDGDEYWYWIHGNWRRDQWDGPRPPWACFDRYGPPLGLDFYENHGFRMRSEWHEPMVATTAIATTVCGTARTHSYDWQGNGGNNWSNQWLGQHGNDHGSWNGDMQRRDKAATTRAVRKTTKSNCWEPRANRRDGAAATTASHDNGTVHLYNNGFIGGTAAAPETAIRVAGIPAAIPETEIRAGPVTRHASAGIRTAAAPAETIPVAAPAATLAAFSTR